jgi:acyl-CoA thioester hydrolase
MSADRILVHTESIPIRWGDMDAMNHVNNTVYFRYMEQARLGWLEERMGSLHAGRNDGPLIVNASCTFMQPMSYPGTVEVRMYLGEPGRTSIGSFYELHVGGRLYAEGAAKMVWVDLQTGRPTPLPDDVTALFAR